MKAILDNGMKYIMARSINQKGLQIFILKFLSPKQTWEKP